MAQNYVVANISIKDQDQNSLLETGAYKGIEIDFISPGPRQIDITSGFGSSTGIHEKQMFQIAFTSQGTSEIYGASQGETQDKFIKLYGGNANTITIKDATGSNNSIERIHVMAQDGTWTELKNLVNNPSKVVISINLPPSDGGVSTGGEVEFDEHGTKLIYKVPDKSKRVKMNKGKDHENGQRYNINHRFKNNMMIGYFKTGKGQEKIEQKLDGPNHGGCKSLPNCMWYEPSIVVDTGKIELGGEWPHPENKSGLRMDFHKDIDGGIKEQWLGYCVICYTNKQGQRVIEQWCAKDPFLPDGKPKNNWELNLRSTETGDGKMFPAKYVPRDLDKVMNHEDGFEAEIRMHGATEGDTEMKWCYVYEITPPT